MLFNFISLEETKKKKKQVIKNACTVTLQTIIFCRFSYF